MAKNKIKVNEGAVIMETGSSVKNKTGGWRALRPVMDVNKCTKCMICWQFCPENAISKGLKIDYDFCKGCSVCAEVCPVKAIRMEKEKK
jgi:2-oxoacid:acceptor oxidoreductase delta subunit (pyruvate/2-ketoisovalerate family)